MSPSDGLTTLAEVLGGHTDAAGVREVVTRPLRHGAWELLSSHALTDLPCELQLVRSKYKPSRKLTACYVLSSADRATTPRHAVVSWSLDGAEVRVSLSVAPEDSSMPQLARLVDPGHVASLVGSMTGRPVPAPGFAGVHPVRYRPGQRHVLLAVPGEGDGDGAVYVKTDRDRSGASAVVIAEVLNNAFEQQYAAASAAVPLGWAAEDAAALWWRAPGLPLARLLTGRSTGRSSAVRRVGRALRVLHGVSATETAGTAVSDPEERARAEASSALGAATHIAALLPEVGAAYASLVSDALDVLQKLPSEQPVLVHGDFKADNILIHRGRLRILDLDRSSRAEPALDLGKFMADLSWWCTEPDRTALWEAFRAGYGHCDPLRWTRATMWAVIFQLKITARRCAVHDPAWERVVRDRVAAANSVLLARGA